MSLSFSLLLGGGTSECCLFFEQRDDKIAKMRKRMDKMKENVMGALSWEDDDVGEEESGKEG